MAAELITGISELTTVDVEERVLTDAAVVHEQGEIVWIGPSGSAPEEGGSQSRSGSRCA